MESPLVTDPARGSGRDIILQAFHWNLVKTQGTGSIDGSDRSWYVILREMADEICRLGFTIVYLPPPWRDDSAWEAGGKHGGGEGYFWHDFDLSSRYGTKEELGALVRVLHERGLRVICDLVPNHRDRERMERDRWPYPGPCWRSGGQDTGAGFLDGRYDLALGHPEVRSRLCAAMDELMEDCGIDGWRWDFVWGYEVRDVVNIIAATRKREYFAMGEYWQGSADRVDDPFLVKYGRDERDRILGWARDTGCCAFDVRLKHEIQTANAGYLKHGLNATAPDGQRGMLVTYVDNHDTGASPWSLANGWGQKHWECPAHFKRKAYAFILSMPGVPCVYWPDCFDWGLKWDIEALIAVRRRAGVVADSRWDDWTDRHTGFAGMVRAEDGAPALVVSIGSDLDDPGPGWRLACSRAGQWTVWERE